MQCFYNGVFVCIYIGMVKICYTFRFVLIFFR